jgi:RNA polymerase sigma factor (sigma-70 family)
MMAKQFYITHESRCIALGVEISDLEQQAFFALDDAVKTYDPERGVKFITWLGFPLKKRFNEAVKLRTPRQKKDPTLTADRLDEPIKNLEGVSLGDTIPDPAAGEALERAEDGIALAEAMSALTDEQRDVLELRYFADLPWRDVAASMDISIPMARFFGQKGLERLRRSRIIF